MGQATVAFAGCQLISRRLTTFDAPLHETPLNWAEVTWPFPPLSFVASALTARIGLADAPFRGVSLEQVTIAADEGLHCAAGIDLRLVDVRITPRIGAVFSLKDAQGVLIDGLNQCDGGNIFLDLRGRHTRDIRLRGRGRGGANRHARPSIALAIDVPRDALVHDE